MRKLLFFKNADEEQRLKQEGHNVCESQAHAEALETFFSKSVPKIDPMNSKIANIPTFKIFQEAERMTPIAKKWYQDFLDGERLMNKKDATSLNAAYDCFNLSGHSFPDSYAAARGHANRVAFFKIIEHAKRSVAEVAKGERVLCKILEELAI